METESTATKAATAAASDVPPEEKYDAYLPHIRRRWLAQQEAWEQRRQEASDAAREVAAILRLRFDADLAVSGICPASFFRAWAVAGAACPFELDLVDLGDCSPTLRKLIEDEGMPVWFAVSRFPPDFTLRRCTSLLWENQRLAVRQPFRRLWYNRGAWPMARPVLGPAQLVCAGSYGQRWTTFSSWGRTEYVHAVAEGTQMGSAGDSHRLVSGCLWAGGLGARS